MDPEEVSGDRLFAEPLAAEPPAPAVELGESVDHGDSTPPHGDPLAPEVAPLAHSAPEEAAVPEPHVLHVDGPAGARRPALCDAAPRGRELE